MKKTLLIVMALMIVPLFCLAQDAGVAEKEQETYNPTIDNHDPDKRTIPITVSVIDTLEAERLFQPIKDSLLADLQKGEDKLQNFRILTSCGKKKVKDVEDLEKLLQAYYYCERKHPIESYDSSPKHKSLVATGAGAFLGPLGMLGGLVIDALVSHKSLKQPHSRLLKDVKKGKLTPKIIQCLHEYNAFLADSLKQVSENIELGWRKCLPEAGITIPRKEISKIVNNPYYRGYHYSDADTLDMLEKYQQRKGWEFLYAGARIYKKDTYPIKFNYYIYNDAPQYKVDDNDLTVYNTNGQLVYVPSLTRKDTPVFAEIHRLVYFADYKKNKYNILSEPQHTQKFLNRTLGEKGGIEKSSYLGAGIALALAFSASPLAYFTGNSLSPRQRGKIIDDFQKDFRDTIGEEYIKQLVKDHERDFGYIYMIERVSNVSFRVVYLNSSSLKPSYCALITYKTGTKPFSKDFSAKLINVPENLPSILIKEKNNPTDFSD